MFKTKCFILLILFSLLSSTAYSDLNLPPLFAQAFSSSSPQNVSTTTLLWRTPVYMITNQYLSVVLHEGSHALAGKLMGFEIEKMEIGFRQGEVRFKDDKEMNGLQSVTISLAGPLANRVLAMAVNSWLNNNEYGVDENIRSFLGTTYIWNRGSYAWYLFRSFFAAVTGGDFVSDWGSISYICAGKNVSLAYWVFAGFVALEALDIYNSQAEMMRNYDRMMGRNF